MGTHIAEITAREGFKNFSDLHTGFRLTRWLYAQCWTGTERPGALFERATSWLLANKVLLPGASVLERFVSRLRQRVEDRVGDRQTALANAIAEFGRIDKTLHMLTTIDDETKRRGTLIQLNRHEGRHSFPPECNASQRALALGRHNWTFAGSEAGGERAALMYTLIESAKVNDLDPEAYLRQTIACIADHPARRIAELLPWNIQLQ